MEMKREAGRDLTLELSSNPGRKEAAIQGRGVASGEHTGRHFFTEPGRPPAVIQTLHIRAGRVRVWIPPLILGKRSTHCMEEIGTENFDFFLLILWINSWWFWQHFLETLIPCSQWKLFQSSKYLRYLKLWNNNNPNKTKAPPSNNNPA